MLHNDTYTGNFADLCQIFALFNALLADVDNQVNIKQLTVTQRIIQEDPHDPTGVQLDMEELIENIYKRLDDEQKKYVRLAFGNLFNWI